MFGQLDLEPKSQERVLVKDKAECKIDLCPKVQDECPNHGGVCIVASECQDESGKCYCRIMVGCKRSEQVINVVVTDPKLTQN